MSRVGGVGNQASYTGGKSPQAQAADDAERQLRQRMHQLDQMAKSHQEETQQKVEETHRQAEIQQNREKVRHESAIEDQRSEFFARTRELQHSLQAELARLRREGDAEVRKLQEHYQRALGSIERDGEQKLASQAGQKQVMVDYTRAQAEHELAVLQEQHAAQVQRLQDQREHQTGAMTQSAQLETARLKDAYVDAYEKSREVFAERHAELVGKQNQTLNKLHTAADQNLTKVRDESSAKIDAYANRQRDPFYRLMTTDARFSDEGDHYRLEATIPPHERDRLSVSVKGDQVVLAGYRRNEEKLELGPGRTQGSASFQSYQETFPLTWPVEARQMTRDYEGDRLIVKVPKKNEYAAPLAKTKAKPGPARAERPNFPSNIPYTQQPTREPASKQGVLPPPEPIPADVKAPGKLVLDSEFSGAPEGTPKLK